MKKNLLLWIGLCLAICSALFKYVIITYSNLLQSKLAMFQLDTNPVISALGRAATTSNMSQTLLIILFISSILCISLNFLIKK